MREGSRKSRISVEEGGKSDNRGKIRAGMKYYLGVHLTNTGYSLVEAFSSC